MSDKSDDELLARARKATPGEWQVVIDEHAHYLGGKLVERRIFTVWEHPQLKGPAPVVNTAVGISATKDGPAQHLVIISEEDAAYIAAANPAAIIALIERHRAEVERHRQYAPMCLVCGADKPCMTEDNLKPGDPGTPCTFDPTPKEAAAEINRLRAEVERLQWFRERVVWVFSEDAKPSFHQGLAGEHELCEPVTAEQLTKMAAEIGRLTRERDVLAATLSVARKGVSENATWRELFESGDKIVDGRGVVTREFTQEKFGAVLNSALATVTRERDEAREMHKLMCDLALHRANEAEAAESDLVDAQRRVAVLERRLEAAESTLAAAQKRVRELESVARECSDGWVIALKPFPGDAGPPRWYCDGCEMYMSSADGPHEADCHVGILRAALAGQSSGLSNACEQEEGA